MLNRRAFLKGLLGAAVAPAFAQGGILIDPYRFAAAAAFTPADLFAAAELGGYGQADDLSTLWKDTAGTDPVTADGDAVARWDDKSGNGNHLKQATASKKPLYGTDGTHHWVANDGVDDNLGTDGDAFGGSISDAFVGLAAREVTRGDGTGFSLTGSQVTGERFLAHMPWGDGVVYFDVGGTAAPNRISAAIGVATGTDYIGTFINDVTNGEQNIKIDGASIASDADGHTVSATGMKMMLFAAEPSPLPRDDGAYRIYRWVAVDRNLTAQEESDTNSWLADGNGVTL